MKLLIVEPHADDAFLSVGGHIENRWSAVDVTILTVFSDKRRAKEAAVYAAAVGVDHKTLGLTESKMLSEQVEVVIPELAAYCQSTEYDRIIGPLGLQHPDHINVRTTLALFNPHLYLEIPYMMKGKNQIALNSNCYDGRVMSIYTPNKRKWRHIPVFKSQSLFFHYGQFQDKIIPEVIFQPTKKPAG